MIPGEKPKCNKPRLPCRIGLYYYNARYYDAALGRFISADTIVPGFRNPQALNRYSYAYNNPPRYNDPAGHQSEEEEDDEPGWLKVLKETGQFLRGLGDSGLKNLEALGDLTIDMLMNQGWETGQAMAYAIVHRDEILPAFEAQLQDKFSTTRGSGEVVGDAILTAFSVVGLVRALPALLSSEARGAEVAKFLARAGKSAAKSAEIQQAFKPGTKVVTLEKDTLAYRYFGGAAGEKGNWVTTELLSDPVNQLALHPSNTAEFVRSYTIPAGTRVIIGETAANFGRPGGAPQIYVADVGVLR